MRVHGARPPSPERAPADFQNDALIALTARRHGATVVTANREDFVLLSEATGVRVLHPM